MNNIQALMNRIFEFVANNAVMSSIAGILVVCAILYLLADSYFE